MCIHLIKYDNYVRVNKQFGRKIANLSESLKVSNHFNKQNIKFECSFSVYKHPVGLLKWQIANRGMFGGSKLATIVCPWMTGLQDEKFDYPT